MTHDELQNDLAAHLGGNTDRMIWTNTQLGPAASPRPDVFSIDKSYANFKADAYEVKVSVSDLRHDVTSGKWQKYRAYAHRVWFAFPRGLVSIDEIPRECGVILRGESGWRAARKPVAQVLDTLPRDAWLKLLIESFSSFPDPRIRPRASLSDWQAAEIARKKVGAELAELLKARQDAGNRYARYTAQLKLETDDIARKIAEIKAQVGEERKRSEARLETAMLDLAVSLGVKTEEANATTLIAAINGFRRRLGTNFNLDRAIEQLQSLNQFLNATGKEAA